VYRSLAANDLKTVEDKILPTGVGRLMKIAADADLHVVTRLAAFLDRERGGDPASIPVARLAAAQAREETKERDR
jgi:hypothetical protein